MPFCSQCGTENPDVAKFCFACGTALVTAPPAPTLEVRKVVSIVFSDLKGSTSMGEKLDSESLREVMTRYFDTMSAELERHGGVVEKFIGDAIMAVFGLPTLHEDDALRAVRAAEGMQRALVPLNDELEQHWGVRLTVRTGVNTGQVVAGDPVAGQRLVTGDAVNVAARLEQAAGAQEILLGDLTYRLVRDYVDVEAVEPLELKGKAERVPAYRLVGVRESAERPRRLDAPMVGRDDELDTLERALQTTVSERRCGLVTVVGEAGVGKSRLIDEFVQAVPDGTRLVRGRCLPYGDGITFWPLAEAVRQAAGIVERDTTAEALEKVGALSSDVDAVDRVASAIGLSPASFPVEELYWGARKLLEGVAAAAPTLVLFEDVHWAEPTFLELVEHVLEAADAVPLLIVCTTRPELVEQRPEWSTAGAAQRIELERLTEDEAGAIAEHLLGETGLDERIRTRIVEAADGNPLFVEQVLSMLIDEGVIRFEDGTWRAAAEVDHVAVPPTIQALLAARLDFLAPDERAVIEPAAVIGQIFVSDAVRHLAPEGLRDDVGARLASLTNKQLVQPDLSRADEDAYRFHHILIRDTAYDAILKRARATFHERFVEWADGVNREGATEYEEILGYHLEQAHRYLSELGPLDDHGRGLGAEGARRLAGAGRRAFARGDVPAAANLLGRAVALLQQSDPARLDLLSDYGEALLQTGRFAEAEEVLDEAIAHGPTVDLPGVAAHASLVRLLVRLRTGSPEGWQVEAAVVIAEAMAVFQEAGDDAGLAKAWRLLAWSHGISCQYGRAAEASERALERARAAGDRRQEARASTAYAAAAMFGPTPVPTAVRRCEEIIEAVSSDQQAEALVSALLGSLLAMEGSVDRARDLIAHARTTFEDLGLKEAFGAILLEGWRVEMLAGSPIAAERYLREAYDRLTALGERYFLPTVTGLLGQTLYVLGRIDEVEPLARTTEELAGDDDVETQVLWRCVRGKLLAAQGAPRDGEVLVREALDMLDATDALLFTHGALLDLAEVQRIAGDDAGDTLDRAAALASEKASPVLAAAVDAVRAASTQPAKL